MNNMRILYDNAVDRATLTASSAANAGLSVANLLVDEPGDCWRASGTTATLTATWASAEVVGCVALSPCNLSADATLRVRGYIEDTDAEPAFDTGAVYCCPSPAIELWNWGPQALGVNAYAYGGGTEGRVWITAPGSVKKITVEISDPTNPAGYVEASRLICGDYFEAEYNPDYGAAVTPVDTSKHYRTEAGTLKTDRGTRHRRLQLDFSHLGPADRATVWDILWGNGLTRPVFASLFPEHADARVEQSHQLYGKLMDMPAMKIPGFERYMTTLTIESI